MSEKIVPFDALSTSQQIEIEERGVNWRANSLVGYEDQLWIEVVDERYGTIRHVALLDTETDRFLFDKIDLDWSHAAFVVIYRQNQGRTEFLLPTERRVLLKDENGVQGNVSIRNIPQGMVKTWQNETAEEAALREVKEETGLEPKSLIPLGELYFDAANSSRAMPFFLAEVEASPQKYEQELDESEDITVAEDDWFALEDIPALKLQCAKTLSGLMLSTGYLGLWPKKEPFPNFDPES